MSESFPFYHRVLSVGILLTTAGLVPVSVSAQEDRRPDLVVAMEDLPEVFDSLDPVTGKASGYRVLYNVFDHLLDFDYAGDFSIIPGIARDWRRIDDTTLEFDIRDDVVFHDGTVMTVADIAFSLGPERMLNEDAPGYVNKMEFVPSLAGVEIVDEDTVRLITDTPSPVIVTQLASWGAPIISQAAYQRAGSWEAWLQAPVGTGPYRLAEYRPDELIRLEAHDAYWGGRPPARSVTFRLVPEEAARVAGLIAGDYDIISNVAMDQVGTIDAADGVQVVGGDTPAIRGVYFDSENNPQLADPRVRRAMSLAIDRDLLVETLWDGRVSVPNGLQTPVFGDLYISDHEPPRYDPDAARALLAETNYDGEVIPFRIVGSDGYAGEFDTSQVLVQMWRDVGINVDLQLVQNWPQVWERPGTGMRGSVDSAFYPDPVSQLWRRHGVNGWTQVSGWWRNDEFNALGQILSNSLDLEARRAAFARMLQIFDHEDPPAAIFHTYPTFYGKREDLDGQAYMVPQMDFRGRNLSFE